MKILMINVTCGIGSTGRICTDIAAELETLGHDVKIAYGRDIVLAEHQKYAVRIGNNMGVKLHALVSRIFDNAGLGSKIATKKFLKWVEEYNPDVIHLHNIHGYYINIELLFNYIKKANKKIIWTLHDCWAFTGHCSHFDYIGCEKWKKQCEKCPQKNEYPKSLLFDRSARNYNRKKELFCNVQNMSLVVPSEWLGRVTKQSFLGDYPVKVIQNGIDTSVFKPTESDIRQRYGLEDKKIILGVSSIWTKKKGFYDFIELSKLISDEFRIVLVGVTDEQIKMLPRNVIGISRTNSVAELCEWYTGADVFVNTTYEDTYPTVNLESQACGTPVVTYKTGGSTESVPVENIVRQGDFENLARIVGIVCNKSKCICDVDKYDRLVMHSKYNDLYVL